MPEKDHEERLAQVAEEILRGEMPSSMQEGVGAIHEMFLMLMGQGFTRLEALWISGYILIGGSERLGE